MCEIKPNNINPQLCNLTNHKSNGVVKMHQKNQPISSESRLCELESTIDSLESIWTKFSEASQINSKVSQIIYDTSDTCLLGRDIFAIMDKLQDAIESKIKRIKDLPGMYKLTKNEAISVFEEYGEPENQSPFAAGSPSRSDVMGGL